MQTKKKGIPFWALHIKYIQSRYLQRMWATRILRREGLGKQWRERSVVYPTEIKMNDNDNDNDNNSTKQFDQNDLDYLCYHKPPIGYITNNDKHKYKITSDETEDEKTIIRSLQYWYDTYSTRKYWDAFDHIWYISNIMPVELW